MSIVVALLIADVVLSVALVLVLDSKIRRANRDIDARPKRQRPHLRIVR